MDLLGNRKVKGIIFDLDGTLVDSVDSIWRAADHVMRINGYRGVERSDVVGAMGMTIFDLFLRVEPRLTQKEQIKLFEDYRRLYMDFITYTKLIPGTKETLAALSCKGLKMAVVTTKSRENAERMLSFFSLRSYFDSVVGFEDVVEHKPSREPIVKAAKELGLDATELMVVGDTEVDIRSGKEAGALTVAVKTGVTSIEKILAESPDFLVEDVSAVPGILERYGLLEGRKEKSSRGMN